MCLEANQMPKLQTGLYSQQCEVNMMSQHSIWLDVDTMCCNKSFASFPCMCTEASQLEVHSFLWESP